LKPAFADLLFVASSEVRSLAEGTYRHRGGYWRGGLPLWLRDGVILFDRSGVLHRAKSTLAGREGPRRSFAELHSIWFNAYYDVRQIERRLFTENEMSALYVRIRLSGSVSRLLTYYFPVRNRAWKGMTDALAHLALHDPAYLELVGRCLNEPDLPRQVELHRELVEHTFRPLGCPWAAGETAIRMAGGELTNDARYEEAFRYWNELLLPLGPC
jgi:hypothetical protein